MGEFVLTIAHPIYNELKRENLPICSCGREYTTSSLASRSNKCGVSRYEYIERATKESCGVIWLEDTSTIV